METKSLEEFLKGLVLSKEKHKALRTSNVCIMDSKEFACGLGKKVGRCICSLMWNDECTFGRNLGCNRRVTLSLKNSVHGGSATRAAISPARLAEVIATKNAVFIERCKREQVARGLNGC